MSARKPAPATPGGTHVGVRLDDATLARVDALIPATSTPWLKSTRSMVIRLLIDGGFPAVEAQARKATPRRKRGAR